MGLPMPGGEVDSIFGIILFCMINFLEILVNIFYILINDLFIPVICFPLRLLGIHSTSSQNEPSNVRRLAPQPSSQSLLKKFRKQTPTRRVRFPSLSGQQCRICITFYKTGSLVNKLPCGHHFHKDCLETWLIKSKFTCPLCRTYVIADDDELKKTMKPLHNRRRKMMPPQCQ